ncbi:MAG: glycosyltransferase family 39 protein, partial [Patescibacteria group bacterium]|nr:glycosyltransferase family 39 protein [Patescibacteria group bacterium]
EHPPLGKNLIGLFSLYLKNEYFFSIFSGLFALFSFYLLSQNFLKNKILSIILSLIIAFEPLFAANYFSNNLDLLVFAFLNLYFYFIFKYLENKKIKNIIFLNILLGIIISVKFYLLALPIIASTLFYFLIKKDKRFIFFYLLTLPLTGIVLVLNYFQYFSKNHSFIDFLKLQKYIFVFHIQGREKALNLNFSIFELLFFGKYYPNLKNWTFEKHYSIFWLIVSFFGYLSLIFKKYFSPISSWIIFYTFFQMFSFTSAKYLIILLPFLYLSFFNLLNQKIK